MLIHKYILPSLAAALLAMVAATGCVADSYEPEPPTPEEPEQPAAAGNVTLTITAAPLGGVTSRGFTQDQLTESPLSPNELIVNWLVAFVDNTTGVPVTFVTGRTGQSGTSNPYGAMSAKVNVELPRGTYSILAFANVTVASLRAFLTSRPIFQEDWQDYLFLNDYINTGSSLIPMSGYLQNVDVKGYVNEEFAVEVVRARAKIEYAVLNESKQKIDIQSFSIGPVNDGDIYLFPDYSKKPVPDDNSPVNPPRIVDNVSYKTHEENASGGLVVSPGDNPKRANFYVKESIADGVHPTNHFHIGLKLKRGESNPVEDVTYALAADDLEFIYRNDYILFPIVISDYVPEFEVIDFPPIGGYPVQVAAVNNEFYATFSSSGAFDISARLRDSNGRTVAIQPYDGTNTQDNYVRFVSSVPAMQLTFDPALGTWQGNFIFTQGTNKHIVLTFEFKIGDLIYTRTLHLLS